MSENKTVKNSASVEDFLNAVEHTTRKKDAFTLLEMMKKIINYKTFNINKWHIRPENLSAVWELELANGLA